MKNLYMKKLFVVALSAITAVTFATACGSDDEVVPPSSSTPSISTSNPPPTTQTTVPNSSSKSESGTDMLSPTGARKYFHYNNMRYAFADDGKEIELDAEHLGDKIGSLSLMDGVTIDDNNIPQITGDLSDDYTDLSTTFADGGNLHSLTGYDNSHRLAVEKDGKYYLAENVGNVDNSPMNFGENITKWGLKDKVVRAEIYDHMGNNKLRELSKVDASDILDKISGGMADDNTDYESLAKAQADGESYQVRFYYDDNTYTTSYVVPSMNHFSWGDDNGIADNFGADLKAYFDGLDQDIMPQMAE